MTEKTPPYIGFPSPYCGECFKDVWFDGDGWVCETCNVFWDNRCGDGDPGEWMED